MKLTYALSSVSRQAGGLFEICRRLAQTVGSPQEISVLGVTDEATAEDLPAWKPVVPEVFQPRGLRGFGWAPGYSEALLRLNPDLVHVHGLWMHNTYAADRWSRRTGRPVIYTAHGMLDPWALQNSGWKKRLVSALFAHDAHHRAACWHVNSEKEARAIRAYGLRNPICVILNGIDLPEEAESREQGVFTPVSNSALLAPRSVLYLGRLHPKKNLAPLIRAWAELQRDSRLAQDWRLEIAGWDQGGYEAELKQLVTELGLPGTVSFLGPKFGADKAACYANCAGFILPSLSEGLPMVVLEAWAHAKPVLMTDECNLPEGFASSAALRIGTDAANIATGLRTFLEMSEAQRRDMGTRGRALAASRFSWESIGEQMRRVCEWAVGGGATPECVIKA
jgi:poly(glycerol-phosphate) alpha-glucosyltransferase